ncbi:MAG: hypothetical protein AAGD07_17270, partial [Planctomycetota bacterium]
MWVESQSLGEPMVGEESESLPRGATGAEEMRTAEPMSSALVPKLEAEMATSSRAEKAVKRVEPAQDFGWLWITLTIVFGGLCFFFGRRSKQPYLVDQDVLGPSLARRRMRQEGDDGSEKELVPGEVASDTGPRRSVSRESSKDKARVQALESENQALESEKHTLVQERDRLRTEIQKTTQTTEHIQKSLQKRLEQAESQVAKAEQETKSLRTKVGELENSGPSGRRSRDLESLQKELRAVRKANRMLQTKLDSAQNQVEQAGLEKRASNGSAASSRRRGGSAPSGGFVANSVSKAETALAETLARVRHELSERKMELSRLGKQRDALIIERDALAGSLHSTRMDRAHSPGLDSHQRTQNRGAS